MNQTFHILNNIEGADLPKKFNNPFCYTPHPLCLRAVAEVQQYLSTRTDWQAELQLGKMFGVLVVKDTEDRLGYVAAFSGNLAHSNNHSFFVPPVYDLLNPAGFFKIEEANISDINRRIASMQQSDEYKTMQEYYNGELAVFNKRAAEMREQMKTDKTRRDAEREQLGNAEGEEVENRLSSLVRESQFQKAELKRFERSGRQRLETLKAELDDYQTELNALKQERKQRSYVLQMRLFDEFRLLNANGEVKGICTLFRESSDHSDTPPSGTGECCAPKLLQYAYLNNLKPVAMAEFWYGSSPKGEVRRHGNFYPACQGKCAPLLKHMLVGLDVECNLHEQKAGRKLEPTVVYEDEWLVVVNKPAGMLSAPGKVSEWSVYEWAREHYPDAEGPLLVHRLDMATSGLLVIAKNKSVHAAMQQQFESRDVHKRYVALLEKTEKLTALLGKGKQRISLPLSPDYINRPCQMVDREHGKEAVTLYEIESVAYNNVRVNLYPQTGRTHQLRVHCASSYGLDSPIIGDELYGTKAKRLYLHAEQITFVHPMTQKSLTIECKAEF